MSALTILYVVLLGQKAIIFLQSGYLAGQIMGSVLVVFPLMGLFGIFVELRFGFRLERLSKKLLARGEYPEFNFSQNSGQRGFHSVWPMTRRGTADVLVRLCETLSG
jgi:hypothetical protein